MSCYHPLQAFRTVEGVSFVERKGHDVLSRIELPCGQCIGCRMRRASDWSMRVMHEAQMHAQNCFVTLTYAPGNLPAGESLEHRDFQLFMKRLRKWRKGPVRFYMCGEYGEQTQRPHYHACLFGVDFLFDQLPVGKSASGHFFYKSATLDALWKFGFCTVQPLVPETASYCARYIMKKVLGPDAKLAYNVVDADGVVTARRPEYAAMSLKPGIGARWFEQYGGTDVFPQDFVVVDGVKRPVPKFYDRIWRRSVGLQADVVDEARRLRALKAAPDNTDERRGVREQVHLAKVSTLKRSLE